MLPSDLVMVEPIVSRAPLAPQNDVALWNGVGVTPTADQFDSALTRISSNAELQHRLRAAIGDQSHQLWFRDRTTLTIRDNELVVQVGNPFLSTWLQRQFRESLGAVAASVLGPAARVRFEVAAKESESAASSKPSSDRASRSSAGDATASAAVLRSDVGSANAVSSFSCQPLPGNQTNSTLSNQKPGIVATTAARTRRFSQLADFIVGTCNQLAVTAARQVCETPGERLNPLYLFGGVGLGKTHLLEGVYCELRSRFPNWNILYLTSEQFANYFTQALRSHSLPAFRQRFRGVDVLLVDDVDFLDGKPGIQEEFLHTVKTLEGMGRQLIVAADRHPRLLTKTSDELSTRFVSGLTCRLEAPDLETRTRIVHHKLARHSLELTADAIALVAQWFRNNVRELEGALNCLEAHYLLKRQRLNAHQARQILADLQRDCVRVVRLADVERAVCDLFRLVPDELRSSSRARHVSQPRMLAMFLARKLTPAAYSEIGEFFGGRNHSTVISAERQVKQWLADGSQFTIASRQWSAGELLQTLEQQLLAS
jgi:chromosomal replication initiator protein